MQPQDPSTPSTEPTVTGQGGTPPQPPVAPQEPAVVTPDSPVIPNSPVTEATTSTETPAVTNIIAPDSPVITAIPPTPAAATVPEANPTAGLSPIVPAGGKKKLTLILAIVAGVVILLGASAAAFMAAASGKPQKITQDAITNTIDEEKLRAATFEGELSFSGGEISKSVSSVTFEGVGDDTKAAAKLTVNTAVTKINFELRTLDAKSIYLRLSGLDGLDKLLAANAASSAGLATQFAPLISKFNNQWYIIDESLLKQAGGGASLGDTTLSKEDAKKIGDLYKKNQFLKTDKKLADQDIHGVASYHLQLSIDKDKLKAFLNDLKSANINNIKLEQKNIDTIGNFDFSKYPFELWVSKKDRFITQFATSVEDSGTTYKLRLAFKDFNKPVNVEKPADAKSVLELLGDFAPLMGGGTGALGI